MAKKLCRSQKRVYMDWNRMVNSVETVDNVKVKDNVEMPDRMNTKDSMEKADRTETIKGQCGDGRHRRHGGYRTGGRQHGEGEMATVHLNHIWRQYSEQQKKKIVE